MSTVLGEQAGAYAEQTGNGRLPWVAARYATRLAGDRARAALTRDVQWLPYAGAVLGDRDVAPL